MDSKFWNEIILLFTSVTIDYYQGKTEISKEQYTKEFNEAIEDKKITVKEYISLNNISSSIWQDKIKKEKIKNFENNKEDFFKIKELN